MLSDTLNDVNPTYNELDSCSNDYAFHIVDPDCVAGARPRTSRSADDAGSRRGMAANDEGGTTRRSVGRDRGDASRERGAHTGIHSPAEQNNRARFPHGHDSTHVFSTALPDCRFSA